MRITRCMRHLVSKFGFASPWRFEAAAMLSQLGCVTLEPEVVQAAYVGAELSSEDKVRFDGHPKVARDLLVSIPRLEPIAWMINQQFSKEICQDAPPVPALPADALVFGAKALRLCVAFDNLRMRGMSEHDAITHLRHRGHEFGLELVEALADMKPESTRMEIRKVSASKLSPGMILQQEIRNKTGMLVVAKGQEITHALLIKLENFSRAGTIEKEMLALVPV
jgi:hypothetical protein